MIKKFDELTTAEKKELLDMLPCEMTDDQRVQFAEYFQQRYNLEDLTYLDESELLERLSHQLMNYLILNKEYMDAEEKQTLRMVCQMLNICYEALYHLYY